MSHTRGLWWTEFTFSRGEDRNVSHGHIYNSAPGPLDIRCPSSSAPHLLPLLFSVRNPSRHPSSIDRTSPEHGEYLHDVLMATENKNQIAARKLVKSPEAGAPDASQPDVSYTTTRGRPGTPPQGSPPMKDLPPIPRRSPNRVITPIPHDHADEPLPNPSTVSHAVAPEGSKKTYHDTNSDPNSQMFAKAQTKADVEAQKLIGEAADRMARQAVGAYPYPFIPGTPTRGDDESIGADEGNPDMAHPAPLGANPARASTLKYVNNLQSRRRGEEGGNLSVTVGTNNLSDPSSPTSPDIYAVEAMRGLEMDRLGDGANSRGHPSRQTRFPVHGLAASNLLADDSAADVDLEAARSTVTGPKINLHEINDLTNNAAVVPKKEKKSWGQGGRLYCPIIFVLFAMVIGLFISLLMMGLQRGRN
ncbi:MAG: hypothetical protein M1817_003866 [Caeruleum heppii]|nr:MAG: hypothetical protein M1817_003866 [Caeruleum heppii]